MKITAKILCILTVFFYAGLAWGEEIDSKALSSSDSNLVDHQSQNSDSLIKKETRYSDEALSVALNVMESCYRLKLCPLTKQILVNVVQAAFPNEVSVSELLDFEMIIKIYRNSGSDRLRSQRALASGSIL